MIKHNLSNAKRSEWFLIKNKIISNYIIIRMNMYILTTKPNTSYWGINDKNTPT